MSKDSQLKDASLGEDQRRREGKRGQEDSLGRKDSHRRHKRQRSRSHSRERRRRSRHSSRSRSRDRRSRSGARKPRSIRELKEERERRRSSKSKRSLSSVIENITTSVKKKSQFDVPPDPTAPPAAITASLEAARQTSSFTGIAASSVLNPNLVAPKHSKSVYIGGIDPASTNERDLFEFFNKTVNTVSGKEVNPVVSVYVNKMKCFGFIELNDYNLATAVIQNLNGIEYQGSSLSLRRPTNYDPNRAPVSFFHTCSA